MTRETNQFVVALRETDKLDDRGVRHLPAMALSGNKTGHKAKSRLEQGHFAGDEFSHARVPDRHRLWAGVCQTTERALKENNNRNLDGDDFVVEFATINRTKGAYTSRAK